LTSLRPLWDLDLALTVSCHRDLQHVPGMRLIRHNHAHKLLPRATATGQHRPFWLPRDHGAEKQHGQKLCDDGMAQTAGALSGGTRNGQRLAGWAVLGGLVALGVPGHSHFPLMVALFRIMSFVGDHEESKNLKMLL
jgi:hypothetical protein